MKILLKQNKGIINVAYNQDKFLKGLNKRKSLLNSSVN